MKRNVGEVREAVWTEMMRARALAFPYPPFGHHPNFKGASRAAALLLPELFERTLLRPGGTVLSYPDYVLKGLRKGLLETGINVVVPAKHGSDYRFLDASLVRAARASSIAGAEKEGERITTLPEVQLALLACVAVDERGGALTKGYGFTFPEGLSVPVVTLVHKLQVLKTLPQVQWQVSAFATPEEVRWFQ